jgi:hypothetical protein
MIVRIVTAVAALALLAGCSTEEGERAQELLQAAEAAQAQLGSSTFDGSVSISLDGETMALTFEGATSREGEWVSFSARGIPGAGDLALQVLRKGDRAWVNAGDGWVAGPPGVAQAATGSSGSVSAEAFAQLARHVKDVRVTEGQLVGGKSVTTIAGEIDTQGLVEAAMKLSDFAPEGFDVAELGIELGDVGAVLTIDERTRLLDTAFVSLTVGAEGKTAKVELRYRLASANEPVVLPAP